MALQLVSPLGGRVGTFHTGDRLRKAREEAGISVGDMAERLGVDRSTVTRWEVHNRGFRRLVIRAYAEHTGFSEAWLTTGEDEDGGDTPDKRAVTIRYSRILTTTLAA